MRVVLTLSEPIPELLELLVRAGAHVTIELAESDLPVSITVHLGVWALDVLLKHASSLSFHPGQPLPSRRALELLLQLLGYDPRRLRVME